ncbi:SulP family inorganic anion transporter [Antarctobacter jejuensis]|uniref:SulP family inorganic anion transporter n=1 Tax=Antarctobacter jejuensis TaxID=1439938 RepID=UPI003FD538DF
MSLPRSGETEALKGLLDRALPPRRWWSRVDSATLRQDAFAGFSNAAIVIPQGVAFATIAGLPPEMGLYTAMITAAIAAFWGSSMVMISGPTTAISAVVFATLQDIAPPGSPRFVELAVLIAILVGLIQLVAGMARLGGLVSFVSHSVMTAFTAAAAVLIAASQLPGALGIAVAGGGNVLERLHRLAESASDASLMSVSIAAATLGSLLLCQRYARRLPGFLIALVTGTLLCLLLDGASRGVAMVDGIAAAFPVFSPPTQALKEIGVVIPGAMAIALVGLLEAISIGRAFAVRRREKFDANQEMIGQGLSNAVGGLFQCYAGSGSFTRSGVNAEAGARTPLAGILSSLFLAVTLLMFSDLIRFIPVPAMAGLILYVAWRLIDFGEVRRVVKTSRSETVILGLTLGAGLLVELDFAIYVGVIASFAVFIYQSSHPSIRVSAPVISATGRRKFRNADLHGIPECPQIVTIRLDGPLYFGSVEHVEHEFEVMRRKRPGQKHVLFYLKGVGKIDLAGADFLIEAIRQIRDEGGTFRIIALFPPLLESLRRFHVVEEIGEDHLHISKGEALAAAIPEIDSSACATCSARVFMECADLPDASRRKLTTSKRLNSN